MFKIYDKLINEIGIGIDLWFVWRLVFWSFVIKEGLIVYNWEDKDWIYVVKNYSIYYKSRVVEFRLMYRDK